MEQVSDKKLKDTTTSRRLKIRDESEPPRRGLITIEKGIDLNELRSLIAQRLELPMNSNLEVYTLWVKGFPISDTNKLNTNDLIIITNGIHPPKPLENEGIIWPVKKEQKRSRVINIADLYQKTKKGEEKKTQIRLKSVRGIISRYKEYHNYYNGEFPANLNSTFAEHRRIYEASLADPTYPARCEAFTGPNKHKECLKEAFHVLNQEPRKRRLKGMKVKPEDKEKEAALSTPRKRRRAAPPPPPYPPPTGVSVIQPTQFPSSLGVHLPTFET